VQAAGYDSRGAPSVEVEVPGTGTVGEPVEIAVPTEEVFSPLLEFGDGESLADTEATHVYEEPGEYEVTFSGAEVLGYRSSARHTITIAPREGSSEPGSGPLAEGGTPPAPLPGPAGTGATTALRSPSTACTAARHARKSALRRLRLVQMKLKRARIAAEAGRLRSSTRRQIAALRRARRRVGRACRS
jgi:PKD domain